MPTTSLPIALGRAIKRLRNDAGWSQDALAAAAKVHRTFLPRVEAGRQTITILSLEKIAKAFKMTAGELLLEAEKER